MSGQNPSSRRDLKSADVPAYKRMSVEDRRAWIDAAIDFMRQHHPDLIQLMEDAFSGKIDVIDITETDYYERDDYYPKMDTLVSILVDNGFVQDQESRTMLFVYMSHRFATKESLETIPNDLRETHCYC